MKEKTFNGKPMSHWENEAQRLVVECLARAALNVDTRSIIGDLAHKRLMALAKAENAQMLEETLAARDRCRVGMAVAISAFMLTPKERAAKYGKKRSRA